jgi:ubiquinone/menaquinone biosynthesis C-methylase UbiE
MVGEAGDSRRTAAGLSASVRAAYDAEPQAWATGPELVYSACASALVAHAQVPIAGCGILDVGAGSGVAGRAALAAGAIRVVSVDLATGLLRLCGPQLHPVAADAACLPFRDRAFDAVLAAFSLSHFDDLTAGLAQARRVGRAIVASAFQPGWDHPAKEAVDMVLGQFGYQSPRWYAQVKDAGEPEAGDPARFAAHADAAGFSSARSQLVTVRTALSTSQQLAAWRLGMAQVAPFISGLDSDQRAEVRRAAVAAVQDCEPLVVHMLVHTATS